MKRILLLTTVALAFTFSSCKQCYTCTSTTGAPGATYCKGDPNYNSAKNGTVTDQYGSEMRCL